MALTENIQVRMLAPSSGRGEMHLACDVGAAVRLPALQISLYPTYSTCAEANDLRCRDRIAPPYDVTLDVCAAHNTELQRDAGSEKKRKSTSHAGGCGAHRRRQTETISPGADCEGSTLIPVSIFIDLHFQPCHPSRRTTHHTRRRTVQRGVRVRAQSHHHQLPACHARKGGNKMCPKG